MYMAWHVRPLYSTCCLTTLSAEFKKNYCFREEEGNQKTSKWRSDVLSMVLNYPADDDVKLHEQHIMAEFTVFTYFASFC